MKKNKVIYIVAFLGCMICAWIAGFDYMANYSHAASDFESYFLAAKSWETGDDPYILENLKAQTSDSAYVPFPYLYTPLVAQSVLPLTVFEMQEAALLWGAGLVLAYGICLFLVGLLCIRLGTKSHLIKATAINRVILFLVAIIVGLLMPYYANLQYGQVNIFILLLLLVYLYLYSDSNKSKFGSGFALGMASVIKIVPAFFLLAHIRSGKSFFFGFFSGVICIVFVSVLLFGVMPWAQFLHALPNFSYGKQIDGLWEISTVYNIALSGSFARLFGSHVLYILIAGCTVGIALTVYFFWFSKIISEQVLLFFLQLGVAAIGMVLLSPIAYFHHLIWLFPFVMIYGLYLLKGDYKFKALFIGVYVISLCLSLINFSFKFYVFKLDVIFPFYFSVNTVGLILMALLMMVSVVQYRKNNFQQISAD